MPWYAIDAVSDAIDESKSLLFPFDLKRWVVLAVMTFFVGAGSGTPSFNQGMGDPSQGGDFGGAPAIGDLWLIVVAVVLVIVLLLVLFTLFGSIFEYVFVDALRSHNVRIRGSFGNRFGDGLRLFGFRLALMFAALVLIALVILPVYVGLVLGIPLAMIALVITVPVGIVFGIALAVVSDFTSAFVVAIIAERGGGIVSTWRETLWPAVRAEWQQFLLYIVLKWGLGIAVGFAVAIALTVVALPLVILFGAGLLVGDVSIALIVIGAIVAIAMFILVHIFVQTPIAVFFRYYSLVVLEKTDIEWTLHPDSSVGPDRAGDDREAESGTTTDDDSGSDAADDE